MGICLIVWGSKCLPGWFGALMQWNLKFKWAFAFVEEGVQACQDGLWHLCTVKTWFDKVAQIGPKIKCPFECGPNRQNRWTDFWNGTFLSDSTHVQLQPSHLIVSASLLHQCVCPNVIVSQLLIFTRFTRTKSVLQTTKKHNLFGSCCQLTWDWDVCGNISGCNLGSIFLCLVHVPPVLLGLSVLGGRGQRKSNIIRDLRRW